MDVWVLAFGILSTGFILSFAATRLFIFVAPRLELIDHPDSRKRHAEPTPLVGGVAMFVALMFSSLFFLQLPTLPFEALVLALCIVLLGVLDDRFGFRALPRLLLQGLLAVAMVYWTGIELSGLGDLVFTGNIELATFALPMTIIGTVGVINAVNFSDGLDGLAGGLVMVALGYLLLLSQLAGAVALSLELLLLCGVLLGFWVLNARFFRKQKAAVFMGDAGSMFLGFLLAWYFISMSQGEGRTLSPVTTLWIFALPLFDTVGIMFRRMLRGRSPFAADREHLHHIFIDSGFSVCKTVIFMLLLAIGLGMIGVLGETYGVHEGVMFWSFIALFGIYFFVMMYAWKVRRLVGVRQA